MAYGGTPQFSFQANGFPFKNYIRIDGLTLDDFSGGVANIAHPDTGQITTAIPGPNQIGLPSNFGRGRGLWLPDDAARVLDFFLLVVSTQSPPTGFAVPAAVVPSPEIVNGDLILTHQNVIQGGGPQEIRVGLIFLSSLIY